MKCPKCLGELRNESDFCVLCGMDLEKGEDAVPVDGSLALDPVEVKPVDDLQMFVGERYSFYEEKWKKAKDPKMHSGFNIAGLLAPFWMAYRKMYAGAVGLVLGFFIFRIILHYKKVSELDYVIMQVMAIVFLCVYFMFRGNSYYYNFAKKKILAFKEMNLDKHTEGIKIEKAGGTNIWGAIGILILLSVSIAVSNVFFPAATDPVRFVKNSEFEEYPNKKIGYAFESYFGDTKWELDQTGDKQVVKFSGGAGNGTSAVTVTILFAVDMETKELVPDGYFIDQNARSQAEFDSLMNAVFTY
jgi:hypothetical protein